MLDENKISPTERFWRLLKPDQKEIRNVYIYAIFNGLVYLSIPLGIQAIVNLIQVGQVSTSWVILLSFVILGVILTGVLQISQLRITENLQQKIFTRAAFEFAFRIPKIKMEALYKHYAPELMNRFFDVIAVQKGLSKILIDFSTAILNIVFGLMLLCFYHPFFILFSLVLVLVVYLLFRFTVKLGLTTSIEESKHKYKIAYWLEELAITSTTFKLAGKTDLPLKRANQRTEEYLSARESHFKIILKQFSLMVVFKVMITAGLLAIGGVLVMNQQMNIGQFVAAEIIIFMVMTSVEKLFYSLETIYDVLTALEKIGQVTDLELDKFGGQELPDCETDEGVAVELSEVSFTYPESNRLVLDKLSMNVAPGERWFITGPNGSGKSTLLHVLAGLYTIQSGSMSYNEMGIGNLNLEKLRSHIGDSLSEEELFEGTIYENISMGREAATYDNVRWAIQNLGLNDFIKGLSEGLNTFLDPVSKRLPRSIIQKLLLARSIADRPKLLLLEDAFQHIEQNERRRIVDFITDKKNQWTIVAVSTDSHLAKKSDRIALMENGSIIKVGTFSQMKSKIGLIGKSHA